MSVVIEFSEHAIANFFSLPLVLQDEVDQRLKKLATEEAGRGTQLEGGKPRHRQHSFTIDLGDAFWHDFKVTTAFYPDADCLLVLRIVHQMLPK